MLIIKQKAYICQKHVRGTQQNNEKKSFFDIFMRIEKLRSIAKYAIHAF